MSTPATPIVTAPKPTATASFIGHWVTVIKAHEKLIIIVAIILAGLHFGNKAYDAYGLYLKNEQGKTNAQIATQDATNADLQKQIVILKANVDAQAKIDDVKIAASKQSLVVARKADAVMPLPLLSSHWADLIALPPSNIVSEANGTVSVTADAAHATVSALESIPALTTQLSATQDKLVGCTTLTTIQAQQITGLNTSIDLEKQGRVEDAKVAKVAERKAGRRWFKIGYIAGIGTAVIVKIVTLIK